MSLTVIPPMPDLAETVRRLQQELYTRNRQLNDTEARLRDAELRCQSIEVGVQELRDVLSPLYSALRKIMGDIDAMGTSSSTPEKSQVWESWKSKLGGKSAEAIDILFLHGALNADQLRLHLKCARTHVYKVISQLNKAGLIRKEGGKILLKEL